MYSQYWHASSGGLLTWHCSSCIYEDNQLITRHVVCINEALLQSTGTCVVRQNWYYKVLRPMTLILFSQENERDI